MQIYIALYI